MHRLARRHMCWLAALALGGVLLVAAGADEPKKESAAAKPTHKVEKRPFKIEVSLKGTLEAETAAEVALSLEAGASPLVVRKAVEHGSVVKKGDVLIGLDLEKIDQAIRDMELDREINELSIRLAELDLPILEKSTPLELAAAELAKKRADEDLKKWEEQDRELTQKRAEHSLRQSRENLEYQKEELKQLEKMYKANDLTEETEEIILRRTRNQVANAEFYFKLAQIERDRTLQIVIPRRDQDLKESAIKQDVALEKTKITLPLTLNQKKVALEKLKFERAKATERLAKMKKDREAMTIKAPVDGIVYYGKFVRGQWSGASAVADKLQRGSTIQPEEVLMTIVQPGKLLLRANVAESDVQHFRQGLEGKLEAAARPDVRVPAKVTSISTVPIAPGSFEARMAVESKDAGLVPGMACTVKFVPYRNEQTIALPIAAVFSDEQDDEKQCVYVMGKDGKPEKRVVKIGRKNDKAMEILQGLAEGERVLLEKPDEPKAASVTAAGGGE